MKIGIYDTEHFETTYALIKVLDNDSNTIVLFTSPEIRYILVSMLEEERRYTWIIKNKTDLSFTKEIKKYNKTYGLDVLHLNTVSHHHLLFAKLALEIKAKTILTIHDANNYFKSKLSISARGLIRYIGKWLLINRCHEYAVILKSTRDYLIEQLKVEKKIQLLPGGIYEKEKPSVPPHESTFKIVIPGSIDQRRRDYECIFKLIPFLEKTSYSIEVVILGTADNNYAWDFLERVNKIQSINVQIKFYKSAFIDQKEYDDQLSSCHFILLPLVSIIQVEGVKEYYGLTKASGSFFDAIRHAKPILLPANIPISPELVDQIIIYQSLEHLSDLIESFNLNKRQYYSVANRAYKNSLNFTVNAFRSNDLL